MKVLKKYDFVWKFILFILILTFILTIINLIFPLKNEVNSIISLVFILLFSFIQGVGKGFHTDEKAYRVGCKLGIINVFILYILSAITCNFGISLKKIIYYFIIVITSILGSVIGINKKNSR